MKHGDTGGTERGTGCERHASLWSRRDIIKPVKQIRPPLGPVLEDFLEGINSLRPAIRQLILFGSRARGNYGTDSDYDVLVVVEHKTPALLDVLYESVVDVLLTHGRLVSLKVFEGAEFARLRQLQTPFIKHIQAEGRRLE